MTQFRIFNNRNGRFLAITLLFSVLLIFNSCNRDDPGPENPANNALKEGYVVVALTPEETFIAQYFENLPTGTVDITQGTAFQSFFPLSIRDGALFMARTDGSAGFSKIIVNQDQEFEEVGIISTVSPESFALRVRDNDFGIFHDRNNPDIANTFNPTTMEVTGEIDMSSANAITPEPVRYQTFIFRGDNEIYVPTRLEAGGNVNDIALPRIDISAGEVANIAEYEGLGNMLVLNRFGQRYIDESGDFYFFHAGNVSIPTISGAIVKIPAGTSDYDQNYYFPVPEVNNPAVMGQGSFMSAFYYYQNDIGFALINEALDQRIIDLVTERGGFQNLTEEDIAQIEIWLFTSPTGAWVQVNLVDQTVSKIGSLPPLSVFDNSGMAFLDGQPYFAIANPQVNALYQLDESTGEAVEQFNVTGAQLLSVFDLSANE